MALTEPQLTELVENYAAHIIEGLDIDSLTQICFDLLCREYEEYTEEEIIDEIQELYSDEVAADLVESVGADPDTVL